MKQQMRRIISALAAMAFMFSSISVLPTLPASAVRNSAHIAAPPPAPNITFIEKLPDVSELTEIGSLTMQQGQIETGFTIDEESNIFDGTDVFYLYIPTSIGVTDVMVHLEFTTRIGGSLETLFETNVNVQPLCGPSVCRIDMQYCNIATIGLYGKSMNVMENINGAVCNVFLYAYKGKDTGHDDAPDAILESIAAPDDYVPIVEVNRIESTAKKTTLCRSAVPPEYSLDTANPQVGIAAEHRFGYALMEYIDPQIDWDDDSSEIRGMLNYTVTTLETSQIDANDGEKPIAYIQNQETGDFSGKLEQGRFELFTEKNLLNCTSLELEAEFTAGTTVPGEDGLALLPPEKGKVNILSGDCIEKPCENYSIHLVHDSGSSIDNTNYAELIFRAMEQHGGEWQEMNRFTVGAEMRDTDGSASSGWASLPACRKTHGGQK